MRVIAFVNPASGGNKGALLLSLLRNHIGNENVFDIIADKGPDRGLSDRASDPSFDVICLVAGGDGTFSWVANVVEKRNLSHVSLVVIPLGSGNDMSRALGWGKKYPGEQRVISSVKRIMESPSGQLGTGKLDVWRLTAVHAKQQLSSVDDHGIEHGARPIVCNYLSLGADAYVELRFNQMRWQNPNKHKSRIGNFKAHAMVGLKYMCQPKSRKIFISDHVQSLKIDGEPVTLPAYLQALIFLNIPSYGAGTQPWGKIGDRAKADLNNGRTVTDMYVDDQRFEVIGLRSLKHFGMIRLLGAHGVRIAQGSRLELTLKSESTPFQADGEPWEQNGGTVSLEAGNKVGILRGPVWKAYSRKRAKFEPNNGQSDSDTSSSSDGHNAGDPVPEPQPEPAADNQ